MSRRPAKNLIPLFCPEDGCDVQPKSETALKEHLTKEHAALGVFCFQCPDKVHRIAEYKNLAKHMLTHHPEYHAISFRSLNTKACLFFVATRPELYLLCLSSRPSLSDGLAITMMGLVEEWAALESPALGEKQQILQTLRASWATLPQGFSAAITKRGLGDMKKTEQRVLDQEADGEEARLPVQPQPGDLRAIAWDLAAAIPKIYYEWLPWGVMVVTLVGGVRPSGFNSDVSLSASLNLGSTRKMNQYIPTLAQMLRISPGDVLDVGLAQAGSLAADRDSFSIGAMSPGMSSPNLRQYDPSAPRDDPYHILPHSPAHGRWSAASSVSSSASSSGTLTADEVQAELIGPGGDLSLPFHEASGQLPPQKQLSPSPPSSSASRQGPGQQSIRGDVRKSSQFKRCSARPSPYSRQVLNKVATSLPSASEGSKPGTKAATYTPSAKSKLPQLDQARNYFVRVLGPFCPPTLWTGARVR